MLPRVHYNYGNSTRLPANEVGALSKLMGAAYLVAIWRHMTTSWFRNAPHKRRLWKKSSCLIKNTGKLNTAATQNKLSCSCQIEYRRIDCFLRQRILVAIALPSFFLCFHGEGAFNGIEWYGLSVWERLGIHKILFLKSWVRGIWRRQEF